MISDRQQIQVYFTSRVLVTLVIPVQIIARPSLARRHRCGSLRLNSFKGRSHYMQITRVFGNVHTACASARLPTYSVNDSLPADVRHVVKFLHLSKRHQRPIYCSVVSTVSTITDASEFHILRRYKVAIIVGMRSNISVSYLKTYRQRTAPSGLIIRPVATACHS